MFTLGAIFITLFSTCLCRQIRHGNELRADPLLAIAKEPRGLGLSSIGVSEPACRTVSGVISPTPSGAICGGSGASTSATGAGTIVGYVSGSPYVASLAACSAQCLATATCTNIYFIQGSNCNLHYGPDAFLEGVGNPRFEFYDVSCFKCAVASSTTASTTATACKTVSVISPTPSGAICGGSGSSTSATGAGTIVGYVSGSPYVASLAACSAQCLATATCTNIYFIQGSNCNLHYGPDAFLEGVGNPRFEFYDASCFSCIDACKTVSGVVSPTPSGAICGASGSSTSAPGAGFLVGYSTGSIYVSSLGSCSAVCLATTGCSNIYFIQGSTCNLHYGPDAFLEGVGNPQYAFYDASCFKCAPSTTTTAPTALSTLSTSTTSSSIATTTSIPTSTSCEVVSGIASPTPIGAVCGAQGSSYAATGAGTLVGYSSGSPYVASIAACSAQCLATSCCTNIYFIEGSHCNLHYGPTAFGVNQGNPLFDFYEASCFTCGRLSCSTSSYNMALTTTFTPPAQCTHGALTQMAYSSDEIWENAIIPVPGTTITSCYPTQFADSVLASAVYGTMLPPFTQLVCPYNWETYYLNTTYIICCPTDFGLLLPNGNDDDRPGLNAFCTSRIIDNILMDLTSYNATAYTTVVATTAPTNGVIVFANAFDGTASTTQTLQNPAPTITLG